MGRWDNLESDWVYPALESALSTGALRRCPVHPDVILSQEDDDPQPSIDAYKLLERRACAEGHKDVAQLTLQTDLIFVLQWADGDQCHQCDSTDARGH